jgi:hypothetical protein
MPAWGSPGTITTNYFLLNTSTAILYQTGSSYLVGTTGVGGGPGTAALKVTGTVQSTANSYVSSDFSVTSSTTLLAITGLTSGTLLAGKAYQFDLELFTTSSGTAGGIQVDLNGGTATATTLQGDSLIFDGTAITARTKPAALNTVVCSSAVVATATCRVWGVIIVNAGGTFIPRLAQNTSNATASIAKTGSYMLITQLN